MLRVIQKYVAKIILGILDSLIGLFTENKATIPATEVPYLNTLSAHNEIILEEYMALIQSKNQFNIKDFYKVESEINYDNKWKAEPLVLFGHLFKENAELCPKTFEIISQIPGCKAAMFSVLEAGKYIPPHKGIYKGIYRCLYVLQLEKNADCWIRIENDKIFFEQGKMVIFDETVEHEVMNASSSNRVALYLDIYRKLPFPLNVYNNILYYVIKRSPFFQTIINEYKHLHNNKNVTVVPFKNKKEELA